MPYSSLERVVEENKDGYYRALRQAQTTLVVGGHLVMHGRGKGAWYSAA